MTTYSIYWEDLNKEAQKKYKELWHENVDLCPIAIVDIKDECKCETKCNNCKCDEDYSC